jgi:hypothetical protein
LLSPFDVHFSQTRIRNEFQDGHTVDETTPEIEVVPRSSSSSSPVQTAETEVGAEGGVSEGAEVAGEREYALGEGCEDLSAARGEDFELLKTPFPRIEVTKWRCKLREADGTPKIDPATGNELYSHEERWFSFDNRRLYCLQKAAAAVWPKEVRCEVVEIPFSLARMRELRKFDTRTFGCSVIVGRREDPNPETWSWRAAVGLPEEAQPEEGVARQKSMRWRGGKGGRGGPHSGGRGNRGHSSNEAGQENGPVGLELMRSALLFFLVYLGLRVVVSIFRHRYNQMSGAASAGAGVSPSSGLPPTGLDGAIPS